MKIYMRDGDRDVHLLSMDTVPREGEVLQVRGGFSDDTGWTAWKVIGVRYFTSSSLTLMDTPYAVLSVVDSSNKAPVRKAEFYDEKI